MTTADDVRFVIKICGVTNEKDAQTAVNAGANALGFNFYSRSPRHISPARASEIAASVSHEFLKVGVFVNASYEELLQIGEQVPLDVLQLHGRLCELERLKAYRIWRALEPTQEPANRAGIEAYLLDTATHSYGGSGKTFDWKLVAKFPHRAIIAGGLDGANVTQAIETARPWGVDACSRLESAPGKKDAQRVHDFIQAARSAMGLNRPAHPTSKREHSH